LKEAGLNQRVLWAKAKLSHEQRSALLGNGCESPQFRLDFSSHSRLLENSVRSPVVLHSRFHPYMSSKRNIPTRRFIKPTFEFLIEKKRDGGEFNQEEIRYIIDSTLDGEMPQHQLAALAMAIYFSGMSAQDRQVFDRWRGRQDVTCIGAFGDGGRGRCSDDVRS
jgi:hypothetical protein